MTALQPTKSPRQELEGMTAVRHPDIREIKRKTSGVILERSHRPGARDIELDAMGESVLQKLEGHKSLEAVRAEFAAEHRLSPLESRALLLSFLRDLRQRGLIQLIQSSPVESSAPLRPTP